MDRQLSNPLVFNLNEAIYTVDLTDATGTVSRRSRCPAYANCVAPAKER